MSRPLPLVIALLGFASAAVSAQEAAAPSDDGATATASEPSLAVKKAPVTAPPRRFVPTSTTAPKKAAAASSTTTSASSAKARRSPFVEKRDATSPAGATTEEDRPRSFWERLFGRRKVKAATPAPTTPAPVVPKPTARPRKPKTATTTAPKVKEPAVANVAEPGSDGAVTTPPTATATPVPKPPSAPRATPAPKATKKTGAATTGGPAATPVRKSPVAPAADADAEAQEKYRYEVAKEKALQDPEVQKLKERADGAVSDDEARKAQRAYNKALFGKMRSVDGTIKDRADRIEAAILKRLDSPE